MPRTLDAAYAAAVEHRHRGLRSPPIVDAVIAGVLLVVGQAEVLLLADRPRASAAAGFAVMALVLAWRRRFPVATAVTVAAVELAVAQSRVPIDSHVFVLPVFMLALYSLGHYAALRRALVAAGVVLTLVTASVFAADGPGAENLGFAMVMVAAPWLAGRLVRRGTDKAVLAALRAQELERTSVERERAAVVQERARIARELHDIVAHSVSVMTVQAGAIEEIAARDPARAVDAAHSIRRTGREALDDLRRLLGVLRGEDRVADTLAPQPGLADLEPLLDQVRQAGLDVDLRIEGSPRPVPPGADLTAFRVVQEALTNILKHAAATRVCVDVDYAAGGLDIEVTDDGIGATPNGSGHGLVGMRERVGLYGGRLEYGRAATGGFRVRAVLPLRAEKADPA